MSRSSRDGRTSLGTVQKLAERASKDRRHRTVLHDALLDRYGRQYEVTIDKAHRLANDRNAPVLLVLDTGVLEKADRNAEEQARSTGRRAPYTMENQLAFLVFNDDRPPRGRNARGLVTVATVLPDDEEGRKDRRERRAQQRDGARARRR